MSRLPRERIFEDYFGRRLISNCPICNKVIKKYSDNWERSHIFPLSNKGQDIYPNLIPLCKCCNRSMKSQNMFEYMLSEGKMSREEARFYYTIAIEKINDFDVYCEAVTSAQNKCKFIKYGYTEKYCKIHLKKKNNEKMVFS